MLNIEHVLAIRFLLIFMLLVGGNKTSGAVAGCISMKNSYVEECILVTAPEASCMYTSRVPSSVLLEAS